MVWVKRQAVIKAKRIKILVAIETYFSTDSPYLTTI
jgi:hypothetical protein